MNRLPGDIWHVDLDSSKLTPPSDLSDEIPPLPEPEGTILKNHLKQVGHFHSIKFVLCFIQNIIFHFDQCFESLYHQFFSIFKHRKKKYFFCQIESFLIFCFNQKNNWINFINNLYVIYIFFFSR